MIKAFVIMVSIVATAFSFAKPIGAQRIAVVAAENFYGSVAKTIGGKYVSVTSILNNPNADPHLFSTSVNTSKAVGQAQVIIYNGLNYDPWMNNLLQGHSNNRYCLHKKCTGPDQVVLLQVADLIGLKQINANPHIWYEPQTFPQLAKKLTTLFTTMENNPSARAYFRANLKRFLKDNSQVQEKIAHIAKDEKGNTSVTATEPVFGYMIQALNLKDIGKAVQWKIMNDAEPTPRMLAQYEDHLISKQVRVLFYNNQVTDSVTDNILKLAEKYHVPTVGISETKPAHQSVNEWLLAELNKTEQALRIP